MSSSSIQRWLMCAIAIMWRHSAFSVLILIHRKWSKCKAIRDGHTSTEQKVKAQQVTTHWTLCQIHSSILVDTSLSTTECCEPHKLYKPAYCKPVMNAYKTCRSEGKIHSKDLGLKYLLVLNLWQETSEIPKHNSKCLMNSRRLMCSFFHASAPLAKRYC